MFYYLHINTSHQNTYFGKFSGQHGEAVDDTAVVGAVNGEFLESGIDILFKSSLKDYIYLILKKQDEVF